MLRDRTGAGQRAYRGADVSYLMDATQQRHAAAGGAQAGGPPRGGGGGSASAYVTGSTMLRGADVAAAATASCTAAASSTPVRDDCEATVLHARHMLAVCGLHHTWKCQSCFHPSTRRNSYNTSTVPGMKRSTGLGQHMRFGRF